MKQFTLLLSFLFLSQFIAAQSLPEQYHTLKEDTETFKEYKVIKETMLDAFWATVKDSISQQKKNALEAQQLINTQKATISQLENTLSENNKSMAAQVHAATHISVLGISMEKSSYIMINFILIAALAGFVVYFHYQGRNCVVAAKKANKAFKKMDDDFEKYKRNALEKQMRLRRELQTERNKLEEVKRP